MAEVLAFPLARRRDLVRRQAEWFCGQSHRAAEANIFRQLQVQRNTLLAKGVDPVTVEREVRALESAVRAEVWRLVLTPEVGG